MSEVLEAPVLIMHRYVNTPAGRAIVLYKNDDGSLACLHRIRKIFVHSGGSILHWDENVVTPETPWQEFFRTIGISARIA